MARTAGDGDEVKRLATDLRNNLEEIMRLNGRGKALLGTLAQSSKDKSYAAAEAVVDEVASIVMQGLPDCGETARKVHEYGVFLDSIKNG